MKVAEAKNERIERERVRSAERAERRRAIWIVEALRWGDREKHSYIVGIFSSYARAKVRAKEHAEYRGGKYECVVGAYFVNEVEGNQQEVWRAK